MLTWQSSSHRKEEDFDRARASNYGRVEELATQGHRFRNFIER